MKTLFYCPFWGMESLGLAEAARRVKAAGYDGMEVAVGLGKQAEAVKIMRDNGLKLILMAFGGGANFPEHKARFRADLETTAKHKPQFMNVHTGHDFFTYEQNCELIQLAMDVAKASGVKILHETHRGGSRIRPRPCSITWSRFRTCASPAIFRTGSTFPNRTSPTRPII